MCFKLSQLSVQHITQKIPDLRSASIHTNLPFGFVCLMQILIRSDVLWLKVHDKNRWPARAWQGKCVFCVCVSLCMHECIWWNSKKETKGCTSLEERRLHNVFWILEGPARPCCQPASRWRAMSNGTDNGEADMCRQHVCRLETKEGR